MAEQRSEQGGTVQCIYVRTDISIDISISVRPMITKFDK